MASNDLIEVTVKLGSLRFPVTVTMTEDDYIKVLKEFEYLDETVQAIHMQTIGDIYIWLTSARVIWTNPDWFLLSSTSQEESEDDKEFYKTNVV